MALEDDSMSSGSGETAVVTLTIPCTPEYVGTARLTILGVASRMGFSYDQIEDIRLAVGEACTNAIERSAGGALDPMITIRSHIEPTRLTVEVEDHTAGTGEAGDLTKQPASAVEGLNSQELGALLMEILVDEVTVESTPGGGKRVRLVKYAGES